MHCLANSQECQRPQLDKSVPGFICKQFESAALQCKPGATIASRAAFKHESLQVGVAVENGKDRTLNRIDLGMYAGTPIK